MNNTNETSQLQDNDISNSQLNTIQVKEPEKLISEKAVADTHDDIPMSKLKNPYVVPPPKSISFFKLFTYSSRKERVMMIFGALAAALNGFMLPMFAIVMGNITNVITGEP